MEQDLKDAVDVMDKVIEIIEEQSLFSDRQTELVTKESWRIIKVALAASEAREKGLREALEALLKDMDDKPDNGAPNDAGADCVEAWIVVIQKALGYYDIPAPIESTKGGK